MKIAVLGLWHLGCVTAACMSAAGNEVIAIDSDEDVVADLAKGKPPLYEPGLGELISEEIKTGRLRFASAPRGLLEDVDVLWVTVDTPVDDDDRPDADVVRQAVDELAEHVARGTTVLISSSQVPVGFTRELSRAWHARGIEADFAYSPENLRLGTAIEAFRKPGRVIVGVEEEGARQRLAELFGPFAPRAGISSVPDGGIVWMSIESAEMTKHALNAFLATSAAFANELARLGELLGASAKEVEAGLKSEPRIGPSAYLVPGGAIAGGTLMRDLQYLTGFGLQHAVETPLLDGVVHSNEAHKGWVRDKLGPILERDGERRPVVAILGLAYKPGTDSLRRSPSIELCRWLAERGASVRAHDPRVSELPAELAADVELAGSARDALLGADAAVIATQWPDYRELDAGDFIETMRMPCVIDPNWFLLDALGGEEVTYHAPGRPSSSAGPGADG